MVIFNECRIDDEGKRLIIEASVENLSYYKNVYIDSIVIDTDKTYSSNGPSNNPVFSKAFKKDDLEIEEYDNGTTQKTGVKKVRLCLNSKDLKVDSLDNNIFFVYILTTGIPDPDTPCGMDNCFAMGIAVNLRPIYNMAMKYIKELDSTCTIPKGFIDMILRLKAFDLSLRTGNYSIAFKQWDKLFKNKISVSPNTGCGCNGIN